MKHLKKFEKFNSNKRIKVISEDTPIELPKNLDDLFYEHKGDKVCLHDDNRTDDSEIGWFEVFYDKEEKDREYIVINHTALYLDTISEL